MVCPSVASSMRNFTVVPDMAVIVWIVVRTHPDQNVIFAKRIISAGRLITGVSHADVIQQVSLIIQQRWIYF